MTTDQNCFFDPGSAGLPYDSIWEHLYDCLSWIDMFLIALSQPEAEETAAHLSAASEALSAREEVSWQTGKRFPLLRFTRLRRISRPEYFLILLALAPELHIKYESDFSRLQGNPSCLRPTLGFGETLYSLCSPCNPAEFYRLADDSALLNLCVFDPAEAAGGGPFLHRVLILRKTAVMFFLGIPFTAKVLAGICRILPRCPEPGVLQYQKQYQFLSAAFKDPPEDHFPLLFQLQGPKGAGRKFLLSRLSDDLDREILSIDMSRIYSCELAELSSVTDALVTMTLLCDLLPHFDCAETSEKNDADRFRLILLTLLPHVPVFFLSISEEPAILDCSPCRILNLDFPAPLPSARLLFWKYFGQAYPLGADVDLPALANRYRLTPGVLCQVIEEAGLKSRLVGSDDLLGEHLVEAISRRQAVHFGALASKIHTVYTWEDLEIASYQKQLLRLACGRLKLRHKVGEQWGLNHRLPYGKGLSLLFYGPPGTGKTMAAQVIARDTGLDLYRVDLSRISSKYIGETEKNLNQVFEEAGKADVILFFDEADSLFSKRTEVGSSNDRHANAETAFLLQKMEEYDGIAILSTNLYQNIDTAFLRRITYTIPFDLPDADTRLRLWTGTLPPEAPLSPQVDFEFLARRFELSGSAIKSILYSAAYLAAGEGGNEILSQHIIRAMKYEFIKMGKMISEEEFEQYAIYL